jgi:outer membrane protein
MKRNLLLSSLLVAASSCAVPVLAQSRGNWTLGVGVHQVNPGSDNGALDGAALGLGRLPVDVDSDIKPTITAEYFIADNLGIEVLAALPFKHEISIDRVGTVGETKHLPPVVSLQYHFNSAGSVSPFVGAGINYTTFFSEKTKGALAGTDLELGNSWGLAAHAGLDLKVGERGALRVDIRWADIDTRVKVNGASLGSVDIDPLVYGAAYLWKF